MLYVAEIESEISNYYVLNQANREKSLLLTADKDFGELIFRYEEVVVCYSYSNCYKLM